MTGTARDRLPHTVERLEETINLAIGGASSCWENLAGAGIFDSTRAKEIAEELAANVLDITHLGEPALGCASTEELLDELRARLAVGGDLGYRTVTGR